MEILANNKARTNARYDSRCIYRGLLPAGLFFLFFIYKLFADEGVGLFWLWAALALLSGFVALMYLDL